MKQLNEIKRLQQSAGINEIKVNNPSKLSDSQIKQLLINNGIDDDYLEEMGGVEPGGDEWGALIYDLSGGQDYEDLDEKTEEKLQQKLQQISLYLEKNNIGFV